MDTSAVLLIGFGGPTRLAEVRPFIAHVLAGRPVPPERVDEVVHHYERLGGQSPYNELTIRQGKGLSRLLKAAGCAWPVYVGFRHAKPFFEETLEAMASDGIRTARGVILAAHQCEASYERYLVAVEQARAAVTHAPQIQYLEPWFDHPLFIDAVAGRIEESLAAWTPPERAEAAWLFTAHSIPVPMAAASPYVVQLQRSCELVAQRFNHTRWSMAYQSRSGRPTDPWLEPSVEDELKRLAAAGTRRVVVIPVGFLTDHIEVLFDLDVEAAVLAKALGLALVRAGTVSDHPSFLQLLAERVQRAVPAPTAG